MQRWALALLIFVLPSLVSADPAADKKRAGELAAESAKAYKRGELEVSAALLKQAYALYPEPNLLYNLARSLEGLGDKEGAVDAYTRYLAEAKSVDDRGAIERRIQTLEAEIEALKPKPAEPPKPVEPSKPLPDPVPPPPPRETQTDGPSALPWLPIIGGALVLAGGGAVGYLARDHEQRAMDAVGAEDAQRLHDKAERYATYANVMFIGGGVLLASGIIWKLASGGRSSSSSTTSGVRASIGPRGFALEWTFP